MPPSATKRNESQRPQSPGRPPSWREQPCPERGLKAGHRPDACNRKLIAGERPGLIRAQDIDRGGFVDSGEPSRKDAKVRQSASSKRGGKGECRRQRNRYRREDGRQKQGNDLTPRHGMCVGIASDEKDDDAVENRQVSHYSEHGFLLRTDHVRGTDKLRRTAEFGANASRCDHRRCFATLDQSSGKRVYPRTSLNRQ